MTTFEERAEQDLVEPDSGESPLDEVAALRSAQAELNERFLRLAADFENYKKRSAKDQAARVEVAVEQVICEVLEVYDNLERAEQADDEALRTGLCPDPEALRSRPRAPGRDPDRLPEPAV